MSYNVSKTMQSNIQDSGNDTLFAYEIGYEWSVRRYTILQGGTWINFK